MANRIFKKETSFFGKLEAVYWRFWAQQWFRFLVIGALNTIVGYVVTLLIRWYVLPIWSIPNTLGPYHWLFFPILIDVPNLMMFVLLFSYSYTMQALFVFKTKWVWHRWILYPLSSIPNLLLQQFFIFVFGTWLGLDYRISYALAGIAPIPFMYLINILLVKPLKKKAKSKEEKELPEK